MYAGLVVLLISVAALTLYRRQSVMSAFLKREMFVVELLFGTIMFASSYVEEEQQFWYWTATSHFALAFIRRYLPIISVLTKPLEHFFINKSTTHSYCSSIAPPPYYSQVEPNRSSVPWQADLGQKFAGAPDIVKDILQPNPSLLGLLVIATYVLAGYNLYRYAFPRDDAFRRNVWPIVLVSVSILFKISMAAEAGERLPLWLQHIPYAWSSFASLVTKARISFVALSLGLLWFSYRWTTDLKKSQSWIEGAFTFLNLFLLGQSRYANIPLYLLFEAQRRLLELSDAGVDWLAVSCLWMQHVSFFALGNSNSLSSVDLTNAYNGITSYSIPFVGALTFISNWAGPIWWSMAAIRIYLGGSTKDGKYADWMGWSSGFHGIAMLFLVGACIILRTHLFIWTVFSPKFLFQVVWMVLQHIAIEGIVGSTLCWIS